MENFISSLLTEEQMAAYLDGMMSTDESSIVEAMIASNPVLEELFDEIDSVDSSYINNLYAEIPEECLSDNFVLPDVDGGYADIDEAYDDDADDDSLQDGHLQEADDNDDYDDDSAGTGNDDGFGNDFDYVSF